MLLPMTVFSCACLIVCLVASYYLMVPFFRADLLVSEGDGKASALQDQRERCVQVLRDLELDRATGRLTDEEYQKMRASVGQELFAIVDKLNQPGS